jgi:hypothetical protein
MIGHTLSISDLLLISSFQEAFGNDDKQSIEKILFENGMDIDEPYTVEFSQHRNLRGQIVSCDRYVGEERCDKAWLKSDACSWEAKVESCGLDLRIQLKTMGQNYNNTGMIMDQMEKHKSGT